MAAAIKDGDDEAAATHLRPPNSLPCSSKRIAHVELYRPKKVLPSTTKKKRRGISNIKSYHLLFLTIYLHQIYWIISTMGTPYTQFLLKAEREGFTVMEGSAKLRAELSHALSDITDENRYDTTKKMGWFSWMSMDIEEHAAVKKRMKEQSVLDSLPKSQRVPKKYAPTFSSMLCTGILVTVHALVILLQVWSVKFNVWMNFVSVSDGGIDIPEEWMELDEEENPLLRPIPAAVKSGKDGGSNNTGKNGNNTTNNNEQQHSATNLMERIEYNNIHNLVIPNHLPTHVVITPTKRGESKVLLSVLYIPTLGITFEYHRRRYYLDQDYENDDDDENDDENNGGSGGMWTKIRCNTTMPLTFFQNWTGISSEYQLDAASVRFGENKFDVRQPTFKDMYKAQLLSPFTVFQLFCVVLWMLDDMW
jgi:hypothetical protein